MRRALYKLFKVESGEAPAVGLNLLQSVFIGLPRLFTLTVAGAVFLDRYSADNLPFVYIGASLILPVAGFLHLHFARRLSFVRLQLGTLMVLSGSDITVSGPTSLKILEHGLESSHPREVLYCLRLLFI